ncbi:MAG: winged helix-turn-helix domain-containing protein [Deltaproteobacteria bacterium]|nr:winged helix-turn-helix domain-containing protein [Deltaproteobacteria bacterium]
MPELILGDTKIDLSNGLVTGPGGEFTLTPREHTLIEILALVPGQVVSRQQLAGEGPTRAADMALSRLRRRLGEAGRHIATVRGVGYRLELGGEAVLDLGWGRLDLPGRTVRVGESRTRLSPQSARLLDLLAQTPGRPVPRTTLARELWGSASEQARLDVAVHRLRQGLELDPAQPRFVVSVPERGLVLLDARLARQSHVRPRAAALLGRDQLLRRILQVLESSHARLMLQGPPGIGKSALATAVAARWLLHAGRSHHAIDLHGSGSVTEAEARLAASLGMEDVGDDEALSRSLAARGALLLVFDGDPPAEFAARLARIADLTKSLRLLVAGRRTLPSYDTLVVDGLSIEAATTLLERRAGRSLVGVDARLVGRLQGNPLAIELVGSRLRGGSDARLARDLDLPLIPLRRAWRTALEPLSDEVRRVAAHASRFHRPFSVEDLAAVVDLSLEEAGRHAGHLVAESVFRVVPGGTLAVPHAAREFLAGEARWLPRARYQVRCLDVLAQLVADVPRLGGAAMRTLEQRWPDLRRGLDAATAAKGMPLLASLARETAERIPRARADGFAEQLLSGAEDSSLSGLTRASCLRGVHAMRWSRQSRAEREQLLRTALELANHDGTVAAGVAAELASIVAFSWGLDEARRLLDDHPLPSDAPAADRVARYRHEGRLGVYAGKPGQGLARLREAVQLASDEELPLLEARCRMALGQALSVGTLGREAEHHLHRAMALTHDHELPEQHVRATLRLAQHLLRLGLRSDSQELLDSALDSAVRAGLLRLEEQCASTLGFLRIGTEDFTAALANLDRAITLSERHGGQRALYVALANRGLALALSGRPGQARQDLDAALGSARGGGGWYRVLGLSYRAVAELLDGDGAAAISTVAEARETLVEQEHSSAASLDEALGVLDGLARSRLSPDHVQAWCGAWGGGAEVEGVVAGLRRAVTNGK